MLALSRMDRIDFQDNDVNRCVVSYSNGARAWINRGSEDWSVEEFRLPPMGYLIRGPNEFLEYRAIRKGEIADRVHCEEYNYFSCPKQMDFGPIVTDGAVAVMREGNARLLVHEILKPSGIALKLGELPGTARGQKASKAFAVLSTGNRLELTFPDLRQPWDPSDHNKLGNQVQLRPVEMRNALRYEISFDSPSNGSPTK